MLCGVRSHVLCGVRSHVLCGVRSHMLCGVRPHVGMLEHTLNNSKLGDRSYFEMSVQEQCATLQQI